MLQLWTVSNFKDSNSQQNFQIKHLMTLQCGLSKSGNNDTQERNFKNQAMPSTEQSAQHSVTNTTT